MKMDIKSVDLFERAGIIKIGSLIVACWMTKRKCNENYVKLNAKKIMSNSLYLAYKNCFLS